MFKAKLRDILWDDIIIDKTPVLQTDPCLIVKPFRICQCYTEINEIILFYDNREAAWQIHCTFSIQFHLV